MHSHILRFLTSFAFFLLLTSVLLKGQTWELLLPYSSYTVQINSRDPNKLYVGYQYNQMFRSYNGGASWELFEIGSIGGGSVISSLFVSTADTNNVFAGGFLYNGIKRSTDGCRTWEYVLRSDSPTQQWFLSEAIAEEPRNPSTLYAVRGRAYNTVYKSTDGGAAWDSISVIPTTLTTRLCTVAIRDDSTNVIFAGCRGGVITRSDDSGITWKRVPVLDGQEIISPDAEVPKIVFSKTNPLRGYAVVTIADANAVINNGGLLQTNDGGATWDRIAFADTSLWAVDVRSHVGNADELFVGGFRTSNLATVIKGDSLVFRSTDQGANWTRFEGIKWDSTPDGDTIRNVWVIRYDTVGQKVYMATSVGLYVLRENANAVSENIPNGLRIVSKPDNIVVYDDTPSPSDTHWKLFSMNGVCITSGAIITPTECIVPTHSLPNGTYLLVWGSQQKFRTALFQTTH